MRKLMIVPVLIAALVACEIVTDDEPSVGGGGVVNPTGTETPDENAIELGSQTFPEDSAVQALMIHGETSKTWTAETFIIEGMGFTQSLSCREDDAITFNADGTFEYESGDWSCFGEEGEAAMDRTGIYFASVPEEGKLHLDFESVTGFGNQVFSGKIWTLEDDAIVISTDYESSTFGTFTVTGRYVSQ